MFIQVQKHFFNYRVCIKLWRPLIDFKFRQKDATRLNYYQP